MHSLVGMDTSSSATLSAGSNERMEITNRILLGLSLMYMVKKIRDAGVFMTDKWTTTGHSHRFNLSLVECGQLKTVLLSLCFHTVSYTITFKVNCVKVIWKCLAIEEI